MFPLSRTVNDCPLESVNWTRPRIGCELPFIIKHIRVARLSGRSSVIVAVEVNVPFWRAPCKGGAFPVGVSPTRQPLQPEATGAAMEATKWLKPSVMRVTNW